MLCCDLLLKCILKKWDDEAWTGLIWPRIETGGELFHKMLAISWLAEDLLTSQEGLCSLNLVIL
jgi:hypothetical protein